jgi:DNA-binding response OmpR family regulator
MKQAKIMIVDDNKDLAQALELRLRAHQYETIWASSGASAMALASSEKPSALILDLFLPGEDGLVVLKQIRALPGLSSLPAVVLTADRSPVNKQLCLEAEAFAVLEKPVDHHRLIEILHTLRLDLPLDSRVAPVRAPAGAPAARRKDADTRRSTSA